MGETAGENESECCSTCSVEVLEALYQLNVEAKRYAQSAENAYSSGFKENARLYSLRKKALYGLKRECLGVLVDSGCVDRVRRHEIDGRSYYCVDVDGFSFHSPTDEWDEPPLDVSTSSSETLDSFDADPDNRSDCLSEGEALRRLCEEIGSPNNYLETPFVHGDYRSKFAGWSQLPGAVEEGDRVDGRFGRKVEDSSRGGDFLFAVGDSFQTTEGECQIRDRYQAWLTPWLDRSPIMPRTVYDVELDGEVRETVRQRRIVDDWEVLADSLADPVPNVCGEQSERAGDAYDQVEFEIGDVIELNPEWTDEGSCYCRIAEAYLSYNLVMVEFEAVGPTEETPLGLSVGEFADDVVAVHESPPQTE